MTDISKIRTYKMKVSEVITETHDSKTIRFKYEPGQLFEFIPGQFIMLKTLLEHNGQMKTVSRAMSFASPPTRKDYFDLTVKETPGGAISTHVVRKTKPGDEFEVKGPYGEFTFHDNSTDHVVLIGAGSGITPLICIIRNISDKNLPVKATLLYSNKTPNDIIYHKEFLELQKRHHIFNFTFTITRPDGFEWKGLTGRIDKLLLEKHLGDEKALYYICGPPVFVEDIQNMLKELGIESQRIKVEKYD